MEGRPLESGPGTLGPSRESELVSRAKHGDVAAYGRLVNDYQTIAFRTAYLIAGSPADAEEAAQDAGRPVSLA